MDPTDKELREQLADGPFPGGGFDDRLRNRIEANLDRPYRRTRSRSIWTFGGAAAVLVVALVLGLWQWNGNGSEPWLADKLSEPNGASQLSAAEMAKSEPLETAMLIGLRKDVDTPDGSSISSYRTVLIAPQSEDKLAIAAQGEGIVMPYSQSFWLLNATEDDGSSSAQNIKAYEAYNSKKLLDVPEASALREGLLSERLLYVGHEYVSVAQTATSNTASGTGVSEYRFVKTVKQLNESNGAAYDPQTEPHVSLDEITGGKQTDEAAAIQQWSIGRRTGSWIGTVYRGSDEASALNTTTEEELDFELPDTVARNNSLAIDWNEIRSLEPAAIDAYASTNRQVLAVVLDREIKVYPYGRASSASNAVTIELDPGESVIMVQWSVEQKYTQQWVTKVNEILATANLTTMSQNAEKLKQQKSLDERASDSKS